jgi:hypothetical protein
MTHAQFCVCKQLFKGNTHEPLKWNNEYKKLHILPILVSFISTISENNHQEIFYSIWSLRRLPRVDGWGHAILPGFSPRTSIFFWSTPLQKKWTNKEKNPEGGKLQIILAFTNGARWEYFMIRRIIPILHTKEWQRKHLIWTNYSEKTLVRYM